MIHTTTWTPDTCSDQGCVIEYQWDDALDENTRTHTPVNIVRRCAAHAGAATMANLWSVLMDENPRKNQVFAWVLANTPFTRTDISWSFDVNRVLTITVAGLTANQQTIAQNWANSHLGIGKVVVVRG